MASNKWLEPKCGKRSFVVSVNLHYFRADWVGQIILQLEGIPDQRGQVGALCAINVIAIDAQEAQDMYSAPVWSYKRDDLL